MTNDEINEPIRNITAQEKFLRSVYRDWVRNNHLEMRHTGQTEAWIPDVERLLDEAALTPAQRVWAEMFRTAWTEAGLGEHEERQCAWCGVTLEGIAWESVEGQEMCCARCAETFKFDWHAVGRMLAANNIDAHEHEGKLYPFDDCMKFLDDNAAIFSGWDDAWEDVNDRFRREAKQNAGLIKEGFNERVIEWATRD